MAPGNGSADFSRLLGFRSILWKNADLTKVMVDSEIRACGFSGSGQSLVLAESSGLRLYTRRLKQWFM